MIMLSGYDDYTYIRNALRLGAYDYLLKPVNIQNFVSMLRLLIPRLKDSSVKLQAEEVSCVRPETQGDYFDLPAKEPYYTKEDLGKNWNIFQPGFCPWTKRAQKIRSRGSSPIYPRKLWQKNSLSRYFPHFSTH